MSGKYQRKANDQTIWGIIGAKIAIKMMTTANQRQNFVIGSSP
jgi:hypothetical protein